MYFVLYLILSLISLTKQITMTPEDRQKAIAEQFYRISIYCMVQNECTNASGLHRLEHMKKIIDEVEVIAGIDGLDFNHRYFKLLLDNSIIETKAWLIKINEK